MSKASHDIDMEESATGYTGHFPDDLPPRSAPPPASQSWKDKTRRLWTLSLSSYSLIHTPDGAARVRHIVMIAILALRTAMSALSIISAVVKGNIAGIVIYSLLAILSFWFTATCLAIIGDAAGDRRTTSVIIVIVILCDYSNGPILTLVQKRWHFDAFLGFCLVVHSLLIILFFFGLGGLGLELTGIAMWMLILGVSWLAGWQPELTAYQRAWVGTSGSQ